VLSFVDVDGDSFPDSDALLALTEANIGSSPGQIDTDQDGLADLAEATAGYFLGSSPNIVDSDGDGEPDGTDRYPLDAAYPIAHLSEPFLDGILSECEQYQLGSFSLPNSSDLRFVVYGCRLDTGLYLAVKVYDDTISCPWTEPWWDDNVRVMIDASNDGFLAHGDDNYSIYVAPAGQISNPRRSMSIIHPDGSSDDLYIPSTDLRAYYRKETAYYFVEMFIRENVLTSFHMAESDTLGLQVSVTDYDSYPGWPAYSVWSQFLDFSARAGTGIIAGSVANGSGQALGDVLVEAQGDISATTSTSPEGVYSLRELPCGTYTLHLSRSGYHDTTIASTLVDRLDSTVVNIVMTRNYLCGDANGSGSVNISDAVSLIAYIFSGGSAPNPLIAGDANCSGSVNISDAVYLIAYIFSGGPQPCAACK
jgi:hypothetical protein